MPRRLNNVIDKNGAATKYEFLLQGVPKKEDESITPLFIGRF
jgi:hypothetical protein